MKKDLINISGIYDSVAEPVNEEINAFQTNNNRFNIKQIKTKIGIYNKQEGDGLEEVKTESSQFKQKIRVKGMDNFNAF